LACDRRDAGRTWGLTRALAPLLALCVACPRPGDEARTGDQQPAIRSAAQVATRDAKSGDRAPRQWRCDGDLGFEDVPRTPLTAIIAGQRLRPVAQVVRGSTIGREIAFDFADPTGWDPQLPCFLPESRLLAGFKRMDPAYAEELALPAGNYRLGPGWQAYYGRSAAQGRAAIKRPDFYGLLILEATSGLNRKPEQMFVPTGRARGRVAICFEDAEQSWLAGAFDVPVCGDVPAPHGAPEPS
jgi:hypothetical protein